MKSKLGVDNNAVSKKNTFKKIKTELLIECNFLKKIFSLLHIPVQMKGANEELFIYSSTQTNEHELQQTSRAQSIADLEEKLQKIKSEKSFTLKNKYMKKSLASKLNKKIKKKERLVKKEKPYLKDSKEVKKEIKETKNTNVAKPIFNNDGKLVFSKFDFAKLGQKEKCSKSEKDPKKILEELKRQEQRVQQLEETNGFEKVKEVKEKMAWKNILKKAEGEKVKDDPTLLKKSIKKMEQKKKQSKRQWDTRKLNVDQKLKERQKKRQENILKKKKEKKAKVVKTAVKRGRVVIKD